jgi:hypothetical protein
MNLFESLSVYSTDTFSEHYSQARSFLPSLILMEDINVLTNEMDSQ